MSLEDWLAGASEDTRKLNSPQKESLIDQTPHSRVISKTVFIEAKGKARPRVTKGGTHTYMPEDYEAWRNQLRLLYGRVPLSGLLELNLRVMRKMPKSWSRKKRQAMRGRWAKPKPDLDNIIGAVMDALLPEDDIVVSINARKLWGDDHRLMITFTEVENE